MAETIVPVIAEKLFDKLITLASDEVSLAFGVKNDVEQLKDTLDTIKVVLLDAEEKQNHDPKLRVWLKKLKEVCYDAEDVLDEIEVGNLHNQVVNRQNITKKVCHFCSSSNPIVFRFTLGHKIKEINKRLAKIAADKNYFNLTEKIDINHVIGWDRETHSFVRDSDVIGRDKDKEMIIERLLQPSYGHENVSVISIVGIGGLGKTTLAKWVYDDKSVSDHFSLRMWVCVSDEFLLKELLIKIINSVLDDKRDKDHMSLNLLQRELRDVIRDKRYLLVLDDVWNEVHGLWLELKCLLNECVSGSKILVTTRSERVASTMDTVFTHKLEDLSLDQCLSIFVKCAFKEGQEKQHPKLIEIGKEIVKKCGGVPLAVRALGCHLHSTTSEQEWMNVRDNAVWKSDQKENMILSALRISYNKLSPPLKRCFVYCSTFPKDFKFYTNSLVYYWMAHGLLHAHNKNEDLENIGMQYIKELMWRSFFQDIQEFGNDAYVFKIHDLMHDVATSLFQNECLTVKGSSQIDPKTSYRHLIFDGVDGEVVTLNFACSLSNVRSVTISSMIGEHISQSFLKLLISRFQFLRTLDLVDLSIEVVPKGIGNLKHLRRLVLAYNPIKKLPSSIYKLQNLQFLSLSRCKQLEGLPREVKYLISLRLLDLATMQKHLPSNGIGCLNSLRHLMIHGCSNLEYLCEDIGRLRALRELVISECPNLISLPRGVRNLRSLEDLRIMYCERLNLDLTTGSDNHDELNSTGPPLRFLQIFNLPQLVKLPRWLLQCTTNTLQGLKIDYCPELTERCKPETGEDWSKIAHIPKIELDGEIIKSTEN